MDNLQDNQISEAAVGVEGEPCPSDRSEGQAAEQSAQEKPSGAELQMQALQEEIRALRGELEAERAARINERNARMSSGRIGGAEAQYFTAAEVRAMSQREVHANYKKILESMKRWN